MATRFYLRDTTAAEPKPNAKQSATAIDANHWITGSYGGGQDGAVTTYPCLMLKEPGASSLSFTKDITEPGVTHYGWMHQWISEPLVAAVNFNATTFTFSADYLEQSTTRNMMPRIRIYSWSSADALDVVIYPETANSATEANTTLGTQQTFYSAVACSAVTAAAGSRIVIEVMFWDNNSLTTLATHAFGFNGTVASGYASYIEFSANFGVLEKLKASDERGSGFAAQGVTVQDNLKKKFWMRFTVQNAGRPQQGITVSELNSGAVARLKKRFTMTFKNTTVGASRSCQSINVTAPVSGWPKIRESFKRTFVQAVAISTSASAQAVTGVVQVLVAQGLRVVALTVRFSVKTLAQALKVGTQVLVRKMIHIVLTITEP